MRVHGRLLPDAEEGAEEGAGGEGEIVGWGYTEEVEVVLARRVEAGVGSSWRDFRRFGRVEFGWVDACPLWGGELFRVFCPGRNTSGCLLEDFLEFATLLFLVQGGLKEEIVITEGEVEVGLELQFL